MKKLPVLALALLLLLTGCQEGTLPAAPSETGSSLSSGKDAASAAESRPVSENSSVVSFTPSSATDCSTVSAAGEKTVVYNSVEVKRGEKLPYICGSRTNLTDFKIVGYERGMLAYDREGKPLKLDWASMDSSSPASYSFLYDWDNEELAAGETDADEEGGWTLNIMGADPAADQAVYILYCDKSITFEGGTVWQNPGYENWMETYAGKPVPVDTLKNYYPYVQTIQF